MADGRSRRPQAAHRQVPGLAALITGPFAQVTSISCFSARSCTVAGYYAGSAGFEQAFVVSQVHGAWGRAEEIHGPAAPARAAPA